jgi:hypothetical protein
MNELDRQLHYRQESNLPRWIQVPAGLFLSAVLLLCLAGSLMMVFLPNEKAPLLAPTFGVFMSLVCLWGFGVCIRLVLGKRVCGGLFGPRTLRTLAWFFLLLPLGGLFTGYFKMHALQAFVQTAAYVSVFFGLRAMADSREGNDT